jgi:hypothetical protein
VRKETQKSPAAQETQAFATLAPIAPIALNFPAQVAVAADNLDDVARQLRQAELIRQRRPASKWGFRKPEYAIGFLFFAPGRTSMIRCLTFLVLASLVGGLRAEDTQTAPAEPEGIQRIFNGQDLTGWDGDPRLWSVKDGVIHGETTAENPAQGNTFIIWKEGQTKDFDLRFSFRCSATNNSGVQYRSRHITEGNARNKWVVRGYQHEIRNEENLPSVAGFIYDERGRRGRLCLVGEKAVWEDGKKNVTGNLIDGEGYRELFKLDDWNDVVIIARGNRLQHYLNNRLIVDFTDNDPNLALKEGILALQLHAGAPMWVEFKDIRIKALE